MLKLVYGYAFALFYIVLLHPSTGSQWHGTQLALVVATKNSKVTYVCLKTPYCTSNMGWIYWGWGTGGWDADVGCTPLARRGARGGAIFMIKTK